MEKKINEDNLVPKVKIYYVLEMVGWSNGSGLSELKES